MHAPAVRRDVVQSDASAAAFRILDGSYIGKGVHANGSVFSLSYQVKRIVTDGDDMYGVWISRNDAASLQARCAVCNHDWMAYACACSLKTAELEPIMEAAEEQEMVPALVHVRPLMRAGPHGGRVHQQVRHPGEDRQGCGGWRQSQPMSRPQARLGSCRWRCASPTRRRWW